MSLFNLFGNVCVCVCLGGICVRAYVCTSDEIVRCMCLCVSVCVCALQYLLTQAAFPFLKVNNLGPASCQLAPLCPRPNI